MLTKITANLRKRDGDVEKGTHACIKCGDKKPGTDILI